MLQQELNTTELMERITEEEIPQPSEINTKVEQAQHYEVVTEKIRSLLELNTSTEWEIGDLIGDLTKGVPKKVVKSVYDSISRDTGMEYTTCMQRKWMSEKFPKTSRNIAPNLSYTHYRQAVVLDDPIAWLEKASDNGWTVAQFQSQLTAAKENTKIQDEGMPCSRAGCLNALPLESKHRVSIYLYHKKFVCCSLACAGNILINNLLQIKNTLLGVSVPPDSNKTPLIYHPDPNAVFTEKDWFDSRQAVEIEHITSKYP